MKHTNNVAGIFMRLYNLYYASLFFIFYFVFEGQVSIYIHFLFITEKEISTNEGKFPKKKTFMSATKALRTIFMWKKQTKRRQKTKEENIKFNVYEGMRERKKEGLKFYIGICHFSY